MDFWMAAILCGVVLAGLVTLLEAVVGTILLRRRMGSMLLLIPLRGSRGEESLRQAVAWIDRQRGVFPGRMAAVDLGLEAREEQLCRRFCLGSGVEWLALNPTGAEATFIAKTARMEYNME